MRALARRETEIDTRPENETEEKREEARLVIAHRMAFVLVLVCALEAYLKVQKPALW